MQLRSYAYIRYILYAVGAIDRLFDLAEEQRKKKLICCAVDNRWLLTFTTCKFIVIAWLRFSNTLLYFWFGLVSFGLWLITTDIQLI